MVFAQSQSLDSRTAMFRRLVWRNRFVGLLRIIVPLVGVIGFAALVGQIYLANLARQYGVAGIRIDRGSLVVETPQYTGIGQDGSRYVLKASEARSPIGQQNLIDMTEASLDLIRGDKTSFHAEGDTASIDTTKQYITVPGVTRVENEDGMAGTLTEVRSDMKNDITVAEGPVDLTFSNGMTLAAANMHYEGKQQLWTFERATLIVQDLPDAEEADGGDASAVAP